MEIKLAEDGMWGGVIPDVLRNNRISLKFGDNLRVDLSGEEFDKLRSLLDNKTQDWFNIAQKIVKETDRKNKIMNIYWEKLNNGVENESSNTLLEILSDFYNEFWENAGRL